MADAADGPTRRLDGTGDPEPSLWHQWACAASTEPVDAALRELLDRLDEQVRSRGPTCWLSGRCCKFDDFEGGHLLYVTGLEIAWFLRQQPSLPEPEHPGACPYQQNQLCTAHHARPLGCRVFFCQQSARHWQNEVYETFLTQLRQLHDRWNLPYRYMEWRQGLRDGWQAMTRK